MVGVEEGREFRFRGDLYSQKSTFPLVLITLKRRCEIGNSSFDAAGVFYPFIRSSHTHTHTHTHIHVVALRVGNELSCEVYAIAWSRGNYLPTTL